MDTYDAFVSLFTKFYMQMFGEGEPHPVETF